MQKIELAKRITASTGIELNDSMAMLNAMSEEIVKALSQGESLFIRGLCTLKPILRKQKVARNISKGTPIVLKAQYVAKFIPSKKLKTAVSKIKRK